MRKHTNTIKMGRVNQLVFNYYILGHVFTCPFFMTISRFGDFQKIWSDYIQVNGWHLKPGTGGGGMSSDMFL